MKAITILALGALSTIGTTGCSEDWSRAMSGCYNALPSDPCGQSDETWAEALERAARPPKPQRCLIDPYTGRPYESQGPCYY